MAKSSQREHGKNDASQREHGKNESTLDFAVIGGTGLYALDELTHVQQHHLQNRYGETSSPITTGLWGRSRVAFLTRHGGDHMIAPHRVNYRANIQALKDLGVRKIIAVNAVGGIHEDMGPKAISICEQLIDYTHGRLSSFSDFTGEKVEHIDFTDPYTASVRQALLTAALAKNVPALGFGCYGCTQGPRLETKAEIARMKRDGCDLVGMTGMPEAVLAREAGLDYGCIAVVANWAAGCGDQAEITMEEIFTNLSVGMQAIKAILQAVEL
jgi:5'-methylthioinosine phosphorylase